MGQVNGMKGREGGLLRLKEDWSLLAHRGTEVNGY